MPVSLFAIFTVVAWFVRRLTCWVITMKAACVLSVLFALLAYARFDLIVRFGFDAMSCLGDCQWNYASYVMEQR